MVGGAGCAVITMIAFVCAVNAAIWIDAQVGDVAKVARNICACLAGGGARIGLLPVGPRDPAAWLPMPGIGTVAGALLALETCSSSILPRCSIRSGRPASRWNRLRRAREPVCRYQANCNLFPVRVFKKIGTEGAERCYFVGQHLRN
jgi:hypothetical protein